MRRLAAMLAVALASACTGVRVTHHEARAFAALRAGGYRIAAMPFAVSAPEEGLLTTALGPVGELLALEASRTLPLHDQLGQLLHDDVVAWLRQSDLEVADPWHVGTVLAHAGLDATAARDPANAARIAAMLGVDGLLYGDLRQWNRSYYVLQSVVEVTLGLELLDAASGESLFAGERSERIGSGLTGGPTGYTSAATEPITGLRSSNLRALTRSVARHAVQDLNGGDLGNLPGPSSPRLAVVALARDHEGPFRAGERVEVIATGSPDCDVRFDLGRMRTAIPTRETARTADPRGERATYVGHYVVDAADAARGLPLVCTIQRGGARRKVAVRYRWDGTLTLGGTTQ
ncbi:MAG: DUF799 family lipoprotein [Planctomycetota bacterium]